MTYDVVIVGGGPGGYNAAIRAGQLGLKVACVEGRKTLGGTCLNVGCIPSKALLHASELYEKAKLHFGDYGIKAKVELDMKQMLARKEKTVDELTKGIAFLFKKNKVDHIAGWGKIKAADTVEVTDDKGNTSTLKTKNIVIATGSEPTPLPGLDFDEKQIVSSTGALDFKNPPKHLVVIGAGVIGLELGSVWRRLGSQVTVVEYLDRILPGMDSDVAKQFKRILEKQGVTFKLGTKVIDGKTSKSGVTLTHEPASGGDSDTLKADAVLVAIGRRPFTDTLGLSDAGVETDDRGFVITDHYKTNVDGIFAIGDVTHGPMLAHKAEDEGVACIERIAGKPGHMNYDIIPGVVYTEPEVASVGKTEDELKEAGIKYKTGKFPFMANSRAKANLETDGFVKILADAGTDRILGGHIVGVGAGEMIAEIAAVMEFGGASEDIARTCHAHPTKSEAVRQAAMGVEGWTMQM